METRALTGSGGEVLREIAYLQDFVANKGETQLNIPGHCSFFEHESSLEDGSTDKCRFFEGIASDLPQTLHVPRYIDIGGFVSFLLPYPFSPVQLLLIIQFLFLQLQNLHYAVHEAIRKRRRKDAWSLALSWSGAIHEARGLRGHSIGSTLNLPPCLGELKVDWSSCCGWQLGLTGACDLFDRCRGDGSGSEDASNQGLEHGGVALRERCVVYLIVQTEKYAPNETRLRIQGMATDDERTLSDEVDTLRVAITLSFPRLQSLQSLRGCDRVRVFGANPRLAGPLPSLQVLTGRIHSHHPAVKFSNLGDKPAR